MSRWQRMLSGFLLALLLALVVPVAHARLSGQALIQAIHSTVLVFALDNNMQITGSGSGSVIDERGLILTNFHVVGDTDRESFFHDERIVAIAVNQDPRRPAVPRYFGQVVRASSTLDLALVRLITDIEGNDLRGCQTLPAYQLGDSENITFADELAIIGFPGIGGQSVTFTTGIVSGFESGGDLIDWIKTDAEINPGNSGGSAVAEDGTLVGVPTAGIVDQQSAGKLGLVRPINRATDLLKDISSVGVVGCNQRGTVTPPTTGTSPSNATLEFLGFSLTDADTNYVSQASSSSTHLYGNFAYQDIPATTSFKSQWLRDGQVLPDTILEFPKWPLNPGSGNGYVVTSNDAGLTEGSYTLEIQAGDQLLTSPPVIVGSGTPSPAPSARKAHLTGRIISADSGRPLSDVTIILLTPGITWNTFDSNNDAHIHDILFTNGAGRFETLSEVSLDNAYGFGIMADGHQPVFIDGFEPAQFDYGGNVIDLGDIDVKRE